MKKSCIAAALAFSLLPSSAYSATAGAGSSFDSRIQRVEYNPDDVIKVMVRKGTASVVQFAQDEKITGVGLGDPEAWNVSVIKNLIFFRPTVDDNPDTNVAIVTNKRNYSFDLISTKKIPTYMLRFSYPKPENKNLLAARAKNIPCSDGGTVNGVYEARGDMSISPYQVWDDGRFTCLRWKNTKDLPIAYRVNSEGGEFLVNTHMENNTMVIHEIAPSFILRLGNSVLELRTNTHVDRRYNWRGTTTGGIRGQIDESSSRYEQSNPAAYMPPAYNRPAAPAAQASLAAAPAAKAPLVVAPAAQVSLVAAPAAKAPLVVAPAAQASLVAAPAAKAPLVVAPAAQASLVAAPAAQASLVVAPAAQASLVAAPAAQASLVAAPAAKAPLMAASSNSSAAAVANAVDAATSKNNDWLPPALPKAEPITLNEQGTKKSSFVESPPKPQFSLVARAGESWEAAFERWVRDNGFPNVVWYYPEGKPESGSQRPMKQIYSGDNFFSAIVDAEKSVEGRNIHITFDHVQKIAIVHNSGISAQAFKVNTGSLSENALRLAKSYGWNTNSESWSVGDDYYVPSGWIFATKGADIQEAMNNLLQTFPVQGQLMKTNKQVYFVKENHQ
ncbi:TrbG/VirB9 family P-type conjugative transfer protein [Aeromonas caviae]|uniref:TrbG/VirB9 family P-type conjugative transfer protein n=1 Tax=Aeromonas caviae TaxID=648 RepID=UPI0030D9BD78